VTIEYRLSRKLNSSDASSNTFVTKNSLESVSGRIITTDLQGFRPDVMQTILEARWTDYIRQEVDLGNNVVLKRFQHRLEMDDKNEGEEVS
jgi:hypothetical protein